MIQFQGTLEDIASVENLLEAWTEFIVGKRNKPDVQEFSLRLMDHIFLLHRDLISHSYRHGPYRAFNICDPKPRNIHKASVRDRLLHHAIYRRLYPFFDTTFISHSYSCRVDKGTHRALDCFDSFARKESANHTKTVWVLKCDIRKFFATIDHGVLSEILHRRISDEGIRWLLGEVIGSFSSTRPGVGLPLGNLTSQLLVNIYMNEFDQFMKRELKIAYYLRYADDFAILSRDRRYLENLMPQISVFLGERLKLALHPDKVYIKSFASGIDFLGWIHFPDHRVVRTASKKRMFRGLRENPTEQAVASYAGMLTHGNAARLAQHIKEEFPFWFREENKWAAGS
jgi:retron-type reverse transcriptase